MDGKFLFKFGEKGSRPGQFNYPWDVATDDQCHILVSDTRNHRLQMFSKEGKFLMKFGLESNWKQFDSPRGVAFGLDGSFITTDFNNHRMVQVPPHTMEANYLLNEGSANCQLNRPQGVIVDPEGNYLVADSRNDRVQVLDTKSRFITAFGTLTRRRDKEKTPGQDRPSPIPAPGPDQMDRPAGLCMTPNGDVVVVDFGHNRILVY